MKHRFWLCAAAALCLSLVFIHSQGQLQVGYAVVTPSAGGNAPVATALFSFTNPSGVLLWEAGVGATEPIRSGRIFVERSAKTRTALALANTAAVPATVTLVVRDASGQALGSTTETFAAGQHRARFLEELRLTLPPAFSSGSLTFDSDQKLAAITLRENKNVNDEALYATLPVVDLEAAASVQSIVFPQIAAGGGFSTQLVLVSRSSGPTSGRIRLVRSDGTPLQLESGSELSYAIAPHGTFRAELASLGPVQVGYAVVTLEQGQTIPAGSAIFQIRSAEGIVSEAGVAAIAPTTRARIFVDKARTETGVAIASAGNPATTVSFELLDRLGNSLGTTSRPLPAGGHLARFVFELFPGLPEGFTGMLEINCPLPVVPITLKLTTNARNQTVLTTLPVADLTRPATTSPLVFPQIAFGSGYSTRLILLNTDLSRALAGTLGFLQSSGAALTVPLGGQLASQFSYQLPAASARQFRPGNTATPQQITLDALDPGATEVAVNEGGAVSLTSLVLDSTGNARDDFALSYNSLSSDIATVDSSGRIQGRRAGFSTLTVSAGGIVKTATINVARVTAGAGGFEIHGIVQDLSRRLYLVNARNHTLLLADDITKAPGLYAGINQSSGLRNDLRLNSLFKNPAFLALNQADGLLYVSDGGNNVIRRVRPGAGGRVETLSLDQTLNNPQSIALDNRGYLWVADAGSHSIKRINLASNSVQTVAGLAGQAGLADGTGAQARFSAPVGLAVEPESLTQELERQRRGDPPPPVRVIVADTGNNRLRRVTESGQVETLGSTSVGSGQSAVGRHSLVTGQSVGRWTSHSPVVFTSPTGVAVDPLGNIVVTQPGSGQVQMLLTNGDVVPAAEVKNFTDPVGIFIDTLGQFIVGGRNPSTQRITYGPPEITSVTPSEISNRGGAQVIVKGNSFSSDTKVVLAGVLLSGVQIGDTQTISFTAPALPSGLTTLTVQNRGGLAQKALLITPTPLSALSTGYVTTVAGGTTYIGDGLPRQSTTLSTPKGLAFDSAGNLFIADSGSFRVRRIDAVTGLTATVAGNGAEGRFDCSGAVVGSCLGDNVLAITTALREVDQIAVDGAGNLYMTSFSDSAIRKVDARTGLLSKVRESAGGFIRIAADAPGYLFFSNRFEQRVYRFDPVAKTTTAVAGNGQRGFLGDNGPATQASLDSPGDIALDSAGNLYINDTGNNRIRRVDSQTGIITTVADVRSLLSSPQGIALDAEGNVYLADPLSITKVEVASGSLTKLISFNNPRIAGNDVAVDAAGNVYYSGSTDNQISRIDSKSKARTAFAGVGGTPDVGDGDLATAAVLVYPEHLSFDKAGNYFIADRDGKRIRRVDARTGIITTVVGDLFFPSAVVADAAGNVYFGQVGVEKVDAVTGKLTTLIPIQNVRKLALDPAGNLYLTTCCDHRVSKYDFQTRTLRVVAGTGQAASSGDGGLATQAALSSPAGIAFDPAGNLYIAEGNRIRKVDVATGIITTVASNLLGPTDVAVGSGGTLFVLQSFDIVRMNSTGGNRVTLAKSFYFNLFGGDNEPSTSAGWDGRAIALDGAGNLFIADGRYGRIRAIRNAAQANPVSANPRIDSITPGRALPGSSVEIVIRGSNLSGTSAIGFSPGAGVSISSIQSTFSQVSAVVTLASDAPIGIRQVSVRTGWGVSNQLPFTVGPPGAGTYAPTISNLTASKPYAVSGGTAIDFAFDFTDADGDITSTGSLSNSAKVTLTRGGCTTNLTSSASLNKPGVTSGKISFTYTSSNFAAGTITLSVKLTDGSGNASNTLTAQPESWICLTITNYELLTKHENLCVIRNS